MGFSGIKNYNFKYDFKHYLSDKIKLIYGANAIYYDFNPGTIEPIDSDSGINFRQLEKKYAFEPALYIRCRTKNNRKINYCNTDYDIVMFYRLGSSTTEYLR